MGHDEYGNLYVDTPEIKRWCRCAAPSKEFPAGSYLWGRTVRSSDIIAATGSITAASRDNVTDAAALRTAR